MSDLIKHFKSRTRNPKKDRFFVLSLHRTATESTKKLLEEDGFSSIHKPVGRRHPINYLSFLFLLEGKETDNKFLFNKIMNKLEQRCILKLMRDIRMLNSF